MLMSKIRILVAGALVTTAVCQISSSARASSIAQVELTASGTLVTLDQNPVVSAVLSTPTTTNGVTTTRYIFLLDDGTGSMDMFGPTASGGALPSGYVPAAGDALTISGSNSPFNGIPELGTPTAITKNSSGNPTPSPLLETIPAMAGYTTQPTAGNPFPSFAGRLVTLDNVTISSGTTGNYGAANVGVTLTDGSSNTMAGFYNPTTYALANQNLFGTPIATGPVNATGLIQLFSGAPELLLMSVTPVPEPSTFVLGALSLMGLVIAWKLSPRRQSLESLSIN
jgi:PEP-CTERM motif